MGRLAGGPATGHRQVDPAALQHWITSLSDPGESRRREDRVGISFGFGGARWDPVRVLERYELLYEAGLVPEALRDGAEQVRAMGAAPMSRSGPNWVRQGGSARRWRSITGAFWRPR